MQSPDDFILVLQSRPSESQVVHFPSIGRVSCYLHPMPQTTHPAGLTTLFFTEMWERFSYYGMRALLLLYMTAPLTAGGLGFDAAQGGAIYGLYTSMAYMAALPGGWIADRLIGSRRAVLYGGLIISSGHFSMAIPSIVTFYLGLVLIVIGTGLLKGNVSVIVGHLYSAEDQRRDAGFSIFYMGINIGAFFAPLVTGFLAQSIWFKGWLVARGLDPAMSWHWGFAAAGIGMAIAMVVFTARCVHGNAIAAERPAPGSEAARQMAWIALGTIVLLGLLVLSDLPGFTWLRAIFVVVPAAGIAWLARSADADLRRIAAVGVFFVASMLFWAIFEQAGVSIALFADQLTRNEVLGIPFPSAWYQALNPLFVIVLAPVAAMLWLRLGARQPSAPVKFALGLAFLAASFLLMIPAARLAVAGKVSPLWLVGLFLLQTIGELCVSPVGLSIMTRLAPPGWTAFMLGIWFLAASWGSKLAGVLGARFSTEGGDSLMWFFIEQAALLVAATAVLAAMVPWLKRLMGQAA